MVTDSERAIAQKVIQARSQVKRAESIYMGMGLEVDWQKRDAARRAYHRAITRQGDNLNRLINVCGSLRGAASVLLEVDGK